LIFAKVTDKNKLASFYGPQCMCLHYRKEPQMCRRGITIFFRRLWVAWKKLDGYSMCSKWWPFA